MTQDERLNTRYEEVKGFIETNKRNPSKHRIKEHDMLNWVKQQRIDENQPCGWFSALMGEEEISPCASLSRDDKERGRDE